MSWPTSKLVYSKRSKERNQENRSVRVLSASVDDSWLISPVFRQWSSSSTGKSERVAYRNRSLTAMCWNRFSSCLAFTPWPASRASDVSSHVKMLFAYRSATTKISRKWSPSLKWTERRSWTSYWHGRKVLKRREAQWTERMTTQKRSPMETNRITPTTPDSTLLRRERSPRKNGEQSRRQLEKQRIPKMVDCSYRKLYVESIELDFRLIRWFVFPQLDEMYSSGSSSIVSRESGSSDNSSRRRLPGEDLTVNLK